jgi:Domain of unknown function (DUF4833)
MHPGALLATLLGAVPAGAGHGAEAELTPVFVVDKSLNRNQVVYALDLDRQCAPRGDRPVHVYWRMRERGEDETEGVLDLEEPIIGLGPQQVAERRADGGRVVVAIRALPRRPLTFSSRQGAEGCEVVATMVIGGQEATLRRAYARVWLLGLISLELEGRADGRPVIELLH